MVRGIVSAPKGRGTAAVYGYRQLLQVLAVKLRQMESVTLERLADEMAGLTDEQLERRVAVALGAGLPSPDAISQVIAKTSGRSKAGRTALARLTPVDTAGSHGTSCRRIDVAPGAQLFLDETHPVLRAGADPAAVAEAVRQALAATASVLGRTVPNAASTPECRPRTSRGRRAAE